MNFTEKYIKMCSEATEIQEGWKPEVGDWMLWRAKVKPSLHTHPFLFTGEEERVIDMIDYPQNYIFLPLQHQLQEMYRGVQPDKGLLIKCSGTSWEIIFNQKKNHYFMGENLEECWLRILMLFRYDKKWNNTKEVWKNGC